MCNSEFVCKILYVDDDPSIIDVVQRQIQELRSEGFQFLFAASVAEAREIIKNEDIVIIILDLNLNDSDGLSTLKTVVELTKEKKTPIYVYTGLYGEDLRRQLLAHGAKEVFYKSDISLLNTVVFAHHAANEERKTQRLRTERDHYKSAAIELQEKCDALQEKFAKVTGQELKASSFEEAGKALYELQARLKQLAVGH